MSTQNQAAAGPWTQTWPAAKAKSGCHHGPGQQHMPSLLGMGQQQHGPWSQTLLQVVDHILGTYLALGGNIGHGYQQRLLKDHRSRHGPLVQLGSRCHHGPVWNLRLFKSGWPLQWHSPSAPKLLYKADRLRASSWSLVVTEIMGINIDQRYNRGMYPDMALGSHPE